MNFKEIWDRVSRKSAESAYEENKRRYEYDLDSHTTPPKEKVEEKAVQAQHLSDINTFRNISL